MRKKRKSLTRYPKDYVILDVEATGKFVAYDAITEVALLRVRNHEIVEEYQTLINPQIHIPDEIVRKTGITNEMVANQPTLKDKIDEILTFIGQDILVGHNIGTYDIPILNKNIENNYFDTLRITRKIFKDFENHKLETVASKLNIKGTHHRAMSDCHITYQVMLKIKEYIENHHIELEELFKNSSNYSRKNVKEIIPDPSKLNPDSMFYKKYCLFTGELRRYDRNSANQIIANIGGFPQNNITKKTNYLIIGDFEQIHSIKSGKSSKLKKAEEYINKGIPIEILSEDEFYETIEDD